jgi:CRISPR/Cas system CMR subunit Cmr6 (Cas7 group RAMP superfamily)
MAFTKVTDNLLSSGVGTGANNLLSLDSTGKLPVIDGSNLTGVAPTKATIDALGISASSITGALPAISGANLTGVATTDIHAFNIDANNNLQWTHGVSDINLQDGNQNDLYEIVIVGSTDQSYSVDSNGNLICTF